MSESTTKIKGLSVQLDAQGNEVLSGQTVNTVQTKEDFDEVGRVEGQGAEVLDVAALNAALALASREIGGPRHKDDEAHQEHQQIIQTFEKELEIAEERFLSGDTKITKSEFDRLSGDFRSIAIIYDRNGQDINDPAMVGLKARFDRYREKAVARGFR